MTIDATKPKLLETYDAAGNRPASRIGLTKDGKEIVLTFPYDAAKVDIVRNLPRRRFDRDAKQWMIPATAEGMDGARKVLPEAPISISLMNHLADSTKLDIPAMNQRWGTAAKPSAPATVLQSKVDDGSFRISHGEGYGGRPYSVGEVFRERDKGLVKVLESSKRYYREDGMSFGVGDEQGYVYSARVRPATEEESKPILEKEQAQSNERDARANLHGIKTAIQKRENIAPGEGLRPEGTVYHDTQTIYGGGDWFVVGPEYIWYVKNNGADGDNWGNNNVLTGGAGAIGYKVPYSKELAEAIEKRLPMPSTPLTSAQSGGTVMTSREGGQHGTRDSRISTSAAQGVGATERGLPEGEQASRVQAVEEVWAIAPGSAPSGTLKADIEHKRQYTQGLLDVHKERVQEALAEGKPVPAEVLKDYPELAPKPEPAKVVAETPTTPRKPSPAKGKVRTTKGVQTDRGRAMDVTRANKTTITKDNPKVRQWRQHPGTMDVLGTDTPPNITAPTVLTQRPVKLDRSGGFNIGRGRGPRITPRMGRLK